MGLGPALGPEFPTDFRTSFDPSIYGKAINFPLPIDTVNLAKPMLKDKICENLVLVEFDISGENQPHLHELRYINQSFVEAYFEFELQGFLHGKKIFSKPLDYCLTGRKIIKSI